MKRLWNAFFYSRDGVRDTFRTEAAFREEVALGMVLIPLAFVYAPNRVWLALMVGGVLLVWVVEILNTAIEAAIDRHGPERHPQAKKAKDAGSAAVLISLIICAFIWCLALL